MPTATRVLVVMPDDSLRHELTAQLTQVPDLELARALPAFPALDDFLRIVRVQKPDFLIVSVEDITQVQALLGNMDDVLAGLPVIGITRQAGHNPVDDELAHKLMRLGIREYLTAPVTRERLMDIVGFVRGELKKHPRAGARPADLYSFFPAKPGVGTSTIALSASCALAEEFSVRTLLLDCDLAAGIVNFHLKLGNSASVLDALGHAENLDEDMWRQMVGRWDKLEVLHAGNLMPPPHFNPTSLKRVLSIARAQYDVICADLGSTLDELSIELLRESQRIFLVTTPEMAPVHLAQARVRSLSELGLLERVTLVLNRKDHWRDHFKADAVAKAVGIPVGYTIGNDYRAASDALLKGSSISSETEIGRDIVNLAQSLRADSSPKTVPPGHPRKFLEFFHVSHAEDPTTVWRD